MGPVRLRVPARLLVMAGSPTTALSDPIVRICARDRRPSGIPFSFAVVRLPKEPPGHVRVCHVESTVRPWAVSSEGERRDHHETVGPAHQCALLQRRPHTARLQYERWARRGYQGELATPADESATARRPGLSLQS